MMNTVHVFHRIMEQPEPKTTGLTPSAHGVVVRRNIVDPVACDLVQWIDMYRPEDTRITATTATTI